MSLSSSIVSHLSENNLTGANFLRWRENINIALIGRNSLFVLTEEQPEMSGENATKIVRERYERWEKANNKTIFFILSSMIDILKIRFANNFTAVEIMNQLNELFGKASHQAHFDATKNFTNRQMKPNQHVHDHLLLMAGHFQEVELHGSVIDPETQTFESLIGGPQKGGKAPATTTNGAAPQVEANTAFVANNNNKKRKKGNNPNPNAPKAA
ncbi:hypothetical protein CsatB_001788 [Cannabis sativa]